jgi:thermitase
LRAVFVLILTLVVCSAGAVAAVPAAHSAPTARQAKKKRVARPARVAHDPSWKPASPLGALGLDALWRLTKGSRSVVVAVVDTGIDVTRPDLTGAVLPGYDVVDGSSDVSDAVGHGTNVAEVAVGRGDNGVGGTGVCWRCALLPVKVAPNGVASGTSVATGIRWAADHGADIINVSIVLDGPDPAVRDAVAYAQAHGALVVAAAGNTGGVDPTYPAAYPGVLGVVAVDEKGAPYEWARHGSWAALAAPGCVPVADAGGGASAFCGSSAAAPVVAGLAALAWSAGASSPAAARRALESSAHRLVDAAAYGRVDARALAAALRRR